MTQLRPNIPIRSVLFKRVAWILLLSIVIPRAGLSQKDWELKRDRDGIRVFSRAVEGFRFNELRVLCTMDCSLTQLAAVLLDYDGHKDWVYSTKTAYLLNTVSASDQYFYTEVQAPWPMQNRDIAVHLIFFQDSISRVLTVTATSEPGYVPLRENLVRVPMSRVIWVAKPAGENKTAIDYTVRLDPGGSIPAWLVNLLSTKGPMESFTRLKEVVQQPRYRDAAVPGVVH